MALLSGLPVKCAAFSVWSACSLLISYSRFWLMWLVWNVLCSSASYQSARKRFVQQPQQTRINITNREHSGTVCSVCSPILLRISQIFIVEITCVLWGSLNNQPQTAKAWRQLSGYHFHRCSSDLGTVWFLVGDTHRCVCRNPETKQQRHDLSHSAQWNRTE